MSRVTPAALLFILLSALVQRIRFVDPIATSLIVTINFPFPSKKGIPGEFSADLFHGYRKTQGLLTPFRDLVQQGRLLIDDASGN